MATKSKKEIIILAMGPSRSECPFDAETWGLNYAYWQVARLEGRMDKIFLTHQQVLAKDPNGKPYETFIG